MSKFNQYKETGMNITDGTEDIYGFTLRASNLDTNKPVKSNSIGQLVSSKLDINDINNLQTILDDTIINPYNGSIQATGNIECSVVICKNVSTEVFEDLNSVITNVQNKIQNITANELETNFTGDINAYTGRITCNDVSTINIASVNDKFYTLENGLYDAIGQVIDRVVPLETKTQYQGVDGTKTTFLGDLSTSSIPSLNTKITMTENNIYTNTNDIGIIKNRIQNIQSTGPSETQIFGNITGINNITSSKINNLSVCGGKASNLNTRTNGGGIIETSLIPSLLTGGTNIYEFVNGSTFEASFIGSISGNKNDLINIRVYDSSNLTTYASLTVPFIYDELVDEIFNMTINMRYNAQSMTTYINFNYVKDGMPMSYRRLNTTAINVNNEANFNTSSSFSSNSSLNSITVQSFNLRKIF